MMSGSRDVESGDLNHYRYGRSLMSFDAIAPDGRPVVAREKSGRATATRAPRRI